MTGRARHRRYRNRRAVHGRRSSLHLEELSSIRVPAELYLRVPATARLKHDPAGVDAALAKVRRIGRASIRLDADRLAVRRREQHRLAKLRRTPNLHGPAEVAVAHFRALDETSGRRTQAAESGVYGIELCAFHEPRPIPVEVGLHRTNLPGGKALFEQPDRLRRRPEPI